MKYNVNIDKTLERFEAWWHCEIVDRPPVTIHVDHYPTKNFQNTPFTNFRQAWTDTEFVLNRFEKALQISTFLGDTFPMFFPNLGPDLCATLYGGDLEFGEITSWSQPMFTSCRQLLDKTPEFNNFYWSKVREMTDVSLSRGCGKWMTGLPDLHTNADLLSALVGAEALCLEMLDDPEGVRKALVHVQSHYKLIYEDFAKRLLEAKQPFTTWAPYLHKGFAYPVSCDFIGILSPVMFEQIVLPFIEFEINFLDRSLFHLDGPGALKHLDRLLEIPKLNGIQWVYGAGQGAAARWIDVYKKIQAAGKAIQLICQSPSDANAVMEHLRPEGVWIHIKEGVYGRDEAKHLIKQVENWTCSLRL